MTQLTETFKEGKAFSYVISDTYMHAYMQVTQLTERVHTYIQT